MVFSGADGQKRVEVRKSTPEPKIKQEEQKLIRNGFESMRLIL